MTSQRRPEAVCAEGEATVDGTGRITPDLASYPERPLPKPNERRAASPEVLAPGTGLGTVNHTLNSSQSRAFAALDEANPLFLGPGAAAHPAVLLELANQVLMRNVRLGPWLHAASTVTNWSPAHDGEEVEVRSRVADCFERKGHQFVVLDLVIVGAADHLIQHVMHTAIFQPNFIKRR